MIKSSAAFSITVTDRGTVTVFIDGDKYLPGNGYTREQATIALEALAARLYDVLGADDE